MRTAEVFNNRNGSRHHGRTQVSPMLYGRIMIPIVVAAALLSHSVNVNAFSLPRTPGPSFRLAPAASSSCSRIRPVRSLLHQTQITMENTTKEVYHPDDSVLPVATDEDAAAAVDHFEVEALDGKGHQLPQQKQEEEDNGMQLNIWAARALLLLVAAIWGTNFASVKYLEDLCFHPPCNHPPSEFAFARFGIAALVSLPLLFRQRKDVILAGFECGLWITFGYVTQAMALSTISAGKCAFICSLTVVFVPLVEALVYGKPMKPLNLLAAVIAVSGVGVLENMINVSEIFGLGSASVASVAGVPPAFAETGSSITAAVSNLAATATPAGAVAPETAMSSSSMVTAAGPLASLAATLGVSKGSVIALGQPIGFGFAFTRIEAVQEQYKDVRNRVLTIAAAQCVAVGLLSLVWVLYDYNWTLPDFGYMIEIHRITALAWTGIVTTVFAIFLEGIALQTATATDAALAFASEPVWASLFGFMLLHEQLGVNAYVGGAVIMVACLTGSLSDVFESAFAAPTLASSGTEEKKEEDERDQDGPL